MGKYSGILLCTDFDGTIAVHGKALPGNIEAVARFTAEGGRFTVISGRAPSNLFAMTEPLSVNAPLGALNGTLLFERESGKHLYAGHLSAGAKQEFAALRNRFDFIRDFHYFTAEEHFYYSTATSEERTFEEFLASVPDEGLHKCCINTEVECSAYLRDTLNAEWGDRFAVSRSWNGGIEIQSAAYSKGNAVRRIREILGDEIKTVICVGDYENDIPMFAAADISIAIGDGSPMTLAAADRVTVPVAECAIAKIIDEL